MPDNSDAEHAEVERLRTATDAIHTETLAKWSTAEIERDAALAENERLRALLGHEADDAYKWRECADQLAASINNGFGAHITTPAGKALAEYERLKAGDR